MRIFNNTCKQKYGNVVFHWASQVIDEVHNINQMDVYNWVDYYNVKYMDKCAKPNKKTLLHNYIESIMQTHHEYILDKHFPMEVINELLEMFDISEVNYSHISKFEFRGLDDDEIYNFEFEENDRIEEIAYDLYKLFYNTIMPFVVDEVFTLLYSNKQFMAEFNSQLTNLIGDLKYNDYPNLLEKDGVIKRSYIPTWLQDGVFLRDRGRCQICGTDLTKVLKLENKINIDHIIPLEQGGSNDPTNFQLTCETCNKSKGDRVTAPKDIANSYWHLDEYKMFNDL